MVTANTTLLNIGAILADADRVLLFPHIDPDPDAMGSCLALCHLLRRQGRQAMILMEEPVPVYLRFLLADRLPSEEKPMITRDPDIFTEPYLSVCVDCSEENRYPNRIDAFHRGAGSVCIDHHLVREDDLKERYDHYYADTGSAASAEIIYQLAKEMGWELDAFAAEALYTGLDGDTGCFMYSNTTPEVHRMAADLMSYGIDCNHINVQLYQSNPIQELHVLSRVVNQMELLAGGRAVLSRISAADLEEIGADVSHTSSVIDDLRSIRGVEIAALLKEDGAKVKATMRAKTYGNVAAIARHFGGGGHIKAAGFRTDRPLDEVYEALREEILRQFENSNGRGGGNDQRWYSGTEQAPELDLP